MRPDELPALTELRENLREAARRDVAARRPARRRRRGIALLAALLLGGAAAAGAADLISAGDPVSGGHDARVPPKYRPGALPQLAVKAKDTPLDWGVGVYTSKDGTQCAIVGRVRGVQLGVLDKGVFHAFPPGRSGACGIEDKGSGTLVVDVARREGRTLVFGRTRPGARSITFRIDGRSYPARTGLGGAFVLVFRGELSSLGRFTVR
jgi:hypothetical protein